MTMKKLGLVTIGQAPRMDVGPIFQKYVGGRAEIMQAGVLDGMTKAEAEAAFSPEKGDYVLTSKLVTGESVVMSREKIAPVLQRKLHELEEAGCNPIVVLCTGTFEGLAANNALLIEPDVILRSMLSAMLKNKRLGVIVPLLEQQDALEDEWGSLVDAVYAAASPYAEGETELIRAAKELADQNVDAILMDCMGYVEASKAVVEAYANLPVILSNALLAKIVSELY
ncbi:AroM family protein [Brevibacillus borstelensis]|uniref:AroM family protein n=1 Tax=Brevibacillus borstelensis TaxID=45462 RepID=UPI002040E558|nr:AroM family protein [Brevibacillus borstelensis]MCM3591960.1 AroM family protein [Brevibacillus borstelensis]